MQHPFDRRPHRTVLLLGLPILCTGLAEPVAGLVDTAFVKDLGAAEAAALGVGTSVLSGLLWVFNFLGISSQTEVARSAGAGDTIRAAALAKVALGTSAAVGIALAAVLWLFAPHGARWMGADGATLEAADTYVAIRALGAPAVLIMLTGAGILRGAQDVRTPLGLAVAVNAVNVVLDAVLIPGSAPLGIPACGIAGAAWATTTAQWLGGLGTLAAVKRRLGRADTETLRARWRDDLRHLFRVGIDLFVRTSLLWVFLLVGVRVATSCGPEAGAAHQAIRSVWMLTAIALDAFAYAAQSLVGWFLGAGRVDAARRVARVAVLQGLVVGGLLWIGMLATSDLVATMLVPAEARIGFAAGWWIAAASQPINAVSFVTDGVHWATRDYAFLRRAMMLASVVGVGLLLTVQVEGQEAGMLVVWTVTTLWITIRAAAGLLRIWPGIGAAPLAQGTSA